MVDCPNNARYLQAVKSVLSVKEGKELFTCWMNIVSILRTQPFCAVVPESWEGQRHLQQTIVYMKKIHDAVWLERCQTSTGVRSGGRHRDRRDGRRRWRNHREGSGRSKWTLKNYDRCDGYYACCRHTGVQPAQ